MAKVKYTIKENTKVGTHSFYAVPVTNGTLDFMEVCEEACENTSIEPSIMRAAVTEYMKAVKRNVLKGFRCALGEQFIYVYPNLEASLKDKKDAQGNITEVAKIEDFTLAGAKSRLGATVSKKYSAQFAAEVSWQRVDASGAAVEDEDITDNGSGGDNNGSAGSGSSGSGGSGSITTGVAAPTINGNAAFTTSTQVTMSGPDGAEIRYTTDGSTPTASSTLYTEAITVSSSVTLKAIAIKDGQSSEVTTKQFVKSDGGADDPSGFEGA